MTAGSSVRVLPRRSSEFHGLQPTLPVILADSPRVDIAVNIPRCAWASRSRLNPHVGNSKDFIRLRLSALIGTNEVLVIQFSAFRFPGKEHTAADGTLSTVREFEHLLFPIKEFLGR